MYRKGADVKVLIMDTWNFNDCYDTL